MSNGPGVKEGQRERLTQGMKQAAARHGYGEASVARVLEQAGVSRATFYENFSDKEACFLAAFEEAAERALSALPRIELECSPALRAGQLLDDLLDNIVRDPAASRVLLVEARGGGPAVRRAHKNFMQVIEMTFDRWLAGPGERGYRLAISGRAVMEGISGILLMRSFRGETARLTEIRDNLVAWINSYSVPEDEVPIDWDEWARLGARLPQPPREGLGAEAPQRLPRGRSSARPELVAALQRERILEAVAVLARTKGFTAMTVADVVKGAAVTREAFYFHFRSKEDAFLAAQTLGLEQSISRTAASFFAGENWPLRVWDGLETLLGYVAGQPDLVYLDVIESYAVGAAAIRRSFDNLIAYTLFLEDGYRQTAAAERLDRLCSEAIGNAILGLMRGQVLEGRTEQLMELLPQTVYLALAPFIGSAAAQELIRAKVAALDQAATA